MPRRREFPSSIKREAFSRSAGYCECGLITGKPSCGASLGPGNLFYEHILPDWLGGTPTLDNAACLTKTCWKIKTDQYDKPIIGDTRRMRDRHLGIKDVFQRLPGNKFDPRKKKVNGRVVNRETGERWITR